MATEEMVGQGRGRHQVWRCDVCRRIYRSHTEATRCEEEPLEPLPLKLGARIRHINRATNEERDAEIVGYFNWNGSYQPDGSWMAHKRAYTCRSSNVSYVYIVDPEDVLAVIGEHPLGEAWKAAGGLLREVLR